MMVRCGNCQNQFDVPGPGRFTCPVCGSVNSVRAAAGAPAANASPAPAASIPRPPDQPSPRINCPECDLSFIVGAVAEAKCPNCGTTVPTGLSEEAPAGQ